MLQEMIKLCLTKQPPQKEKRIFTLSDIIHQIHNESTYFPAQFSSITCS